MAALPAIAPSLRNVTLFADASLCHKSGAAGWACWAKTNGHATILEGGAFKRPVRQSYEAELFALVNGMAVLRSHGLLPAEVMLQSDNMRALQVIMNAFPRTLQSKHKDGALVFRGQLAWTDLEREAVNAMRELATGCRLVVRHVKGHSSGDGRNWVNRQCDSMAKKYMKSARVVLTTTTQGATL